MPLLKQQEAARYLGYSVPKFYELRKQGVIPEVRIGNSAARFDTADLDRLIENSKVINESSTSKIKKREINNQHLRGVVNQIEL